MAIDRPTKMARIAAAHYEWEQAWAHMEAELFDPSRSVEGSDYNLHVLDVEATPEMLDDLDRRVKEKLAAPDTSTGLTRP